MSDEKGGLDGEIRLDSNDGQSISLPRRSVVLSQVANAALESGMTHLPVDASGPTLQKIVEYLMHHQGVDPGIPEKPLMKAVIAPWDADFIDALATPRQRLYDVILAAKHLDIGSLWHLGCAKVASIVRGTPINKIKTVLDPNYVDPVQEEKQ